MEPSDEEEEEEVIEVTPEGIERARVRVDELSLLIKKCGYALEEVFEKVPPFYRNGALCVSINRGLLNLLDTVRLCKFLTDEVEGLFNELQESLQLALGFISDYTFSTGVEEREIGREEEDEITNRLAYTAKLIRLNQHSLSIRLLIEAPEHCRLELEARAERELAAESNGGVEAQASRPKLANLAYGKPHTRQLSYGPIEPPVWFQPATREREWKQVQAALRSIAGGGAAAKAAEAAKAAAAAAAAAAASPAGPEPSFADGEDRPPPGSEMPVILFVTGPSGSGKTSYARFVAQKLAYLDYHCQFSCAEPSAPGQLDPPAAAAASGGDDDDDEAAEEDAETIMRACLAPQQLEGLAPFEVQRAFRTLFWRRRGVLLLDNMQSEEQLAPLLPSRGRCLVIVTSSRPFPGLLKRASKVVKIHQHLESLSPAAAALVLRQHNRRLDAGAAASLADQCDRYPAALDVVARMAELRPAAGVQKALEASPGRGERRLLSSAPAAALVAHPASNMRRALYIAMDTLPSASRALLRRLWVFPGPFSASACRAIFGMDAAELRDAAEPLYEHGLLCEVLDRSVERRRRSQAAATPSPGGPPSRDPLGPISGETRLRLHATVRALSAALAESDGGGGGGFPDESLLSAYCAHFRDLLGEVDDLLDSSQASRQAEGFRRYDADAHNVRAAAELARDGLGGSPAVSTALLRPRALYETRLSPARRVELYSSCLAALTPAQCRTTVQAHCFKCLADAYAAQGMFEKAIPYYKQCQKRADELGEPAFVASALFGLAQVSQQLSEAEIALDYCRRCRPLYVKVDDSDGLARLLAFTARLQDGLGRADEACATAREAAEVAMRCEDRTALGRALQLLGDVHARAERWEESLEPMREASNVAQQTGDLRTLARALKGLERACEQLQRLYRAHVYRERLARLMAHSDLPLF